MLECTLQCIKRNPACWTLTEARYTWMLGDTAGARGGAGDRGSGGRRGGGCRGGGRGTAREGAEEQRAGDAARQQARRGRCRQEACRLEEAYCLKEASRGQGSCEGHSLKATKDKVCVQVEHGMLWSTRSRRRSLRSVGGHPSNASKAR